MAYKLSYANQGKTRNLPVSPEVARAYELAAQAAGIDEIRVTSGGQSGERRTGSHRHDEGGAGDIQLVRGGRVLDFTNPNDLPYFTNFVANAKSSGLTGFGAGTDYMGSSTIHAGGGTPAVWGAGGRGTNAPDWLRQAYGMTINSNPVTAPAATTVAPAGTAATAAPAVAEPEKPYASALGGLEQMLGGLTGKSKEEPAPAQAQPAAPAINPNIPDPQAMQTMMANLLQKRRGTPGLSLMGMG